jgi:hypothetical protein
VIPVASSVLAFVIALVALPALAEAQGRVSPRQGQSARGHLTPSDVQDQFDAYAIVQAQDALKLSDEQYPQFVRRARTLHTTRRRMQARRMRMINQLGQLLRAGNASDERLASATRALDTHERASLEAIQKAYAAIDEILDTRQRARFRVLEQQLERKKIEMLMRARQRR